MTVRKQIREGVKRPNGLAVSDIFGYQGTVGSAFSQLAKDGVIFVAKTGKTVRYFDTPERAAAYLASIPKPKKIEKGARAGWGPNDPAHITSETRVTIAPTPPPPTRTNTFSVW